MAKSRHDEVAERLAKKFGVEYPPSKGADIVTSEVVIEVEVDPGGYTDGIRQLQGHPRRRYLGVLEEDVEAAIDRTKGTKIGVIDEYGNIRKSAGRPAKPRRRSRRRKR